MQAEIDPEDRSKTSDELYLRPGRSEDISALEQIYREIYGEMYPYLPTLETVCPSKGHFLVALIGKEIVGCAAAYEQTNPFLVEWGRLVVSERFRGRGIAKKFGHVRRRLLAQGSMNMAHSECVCYGKASQRLLSGVGFTHWGIEPLKHPGLKPDVLGTQPETVAMSLLWDDGKFGGLGTRSVFVPEDWVDGLQLLAPTDIFEQARQVRAGFCVSSSQAQYYHPRTDTSTGIEGSTLVDVDVNHVSALSVIAQLRAEDFRLCAFMPGVVDREGGIASDRVRLYRSSPGTYIDWSLIQLEPQVHSFCEWMRA